MMFKRFLGSCVYLALFSGIAFGQTGMMTTVAGSGLAGDAGDGGQATLAQLNRPNGVAVDANSNVYIADAANNRIRKVTASTGLITTVAGSPGDSVQFGGDGGPAISAFLRNPEDVALDGAGNLYIADSFNDRIRKVAAATGRITTIAGTGIPGYSGDGSAVSAQLNDPAGVALDFAGNVYIADQSNHR